MTQPHSNLAVAALRRLRDGPGGGLMVVGGPTDPPPAGFPAPLGRTVGTLFEAVLAHAGDYPRVVAATGTGDHLPRLLVGRRKLPVGLEPGVWVVRGDGAPARTSTAGGQVTTALRGIVAADPVLDAYHNQASWLEQADSLLKVLEAEAGWEWAHREYHRTADHQSRPRTLVLLDELLLLPTDQQAVSPDEVGKVKATRDAVVERWAALPRLLAGSRADVVVLGQTNATAAALRDGRMTHDRWLALVNRGRAAPPLSSPDDRLPRIRWPQVEKVEFPPRDPDRPFGPYWPAADTATLYHTLLRVPPEPVLAPPLRPVLDPTTPHLETWSQIDVEGLEALLNENVIGQRHVIADVVKALATFRKKCQMALKNNDLTRFKPADGQKPNPAYRPPVFLFMGESGMGKTHIAELVAGHLFGAGHQVAVELTKKSVRDEMLGIGSQYIGKGPRRFHTYCQRTGGLGLARFDELDKVNVEHGQALSDAVDPFYQVLETWSLHPLDPQLTNHPPDGLIHFANTITVFTGNFVRDDEEDRYGYKRLEQLGEPLLGRFTHFLRFSSLEPADIRPAVDFFIRKYVDRVRRDAYQRKEVELDPSLSDELAREFDSLTSSMPRVRNFRVLSLRFLPARLPEDELIDKFDSGDVVVRPSDVRNRGKPVGGE